MDEIPEMNENEKLILKYLKTTHPEWNHIKKIPTWLKKEFWIPTFLLRVSKGKKLIAVDMLLSGEIPKYQYIKVVDKLLKEHNELNVIIVTLEQSYEDDPEIEHFCKEHGLGLKIIIPGIGLRTIIHIDVDLVIISRTITHEAGWFPSSILAQTSNLERLVYADIISDFTNQISDLGDDENQTRDLVFETIRKLVSKHSSFSRTTHQFMKLANIEDMLKYLPGGGNDHVLHSFRVFIAGCPIIDKFYDFYEEAHQRYCIGYNLNISVEYTWFLTAIFHDIGRTKESTAVILKMLGEELQDDDLEISISGKITRWTRQQYIEARRVLGSLAAFVASSTSSDSWDGGIIGDEEGEKISTDWIKMYDEMGSHAIISAFDFLADLFKKARAADERKYRPFVITHAVPAALAILLHDWRIWQKARNWKLFPINANKLPMAALLVFIDTWDDYKRKGSDSMVHIRDYKITKHGACVHIEWGDSEQFEKEKIKYRAYKRALQEQPFSLIIKAGIVGEI